MLSNRILISLAFILLVSVGCGKDDPKPEEPSIKPADRFESSLYFTDSIINIQNAIQSKDGGYILVGTMENRDLIMKLDKKGNRIWLNVMDDTNSPDGLEHVFYDNDQLVAYRTKRFGNSDGQTPVLKHFTEEGKLIISYLLKGHILGFDIVQENDGYVVLGDNNDFTIQKINKQGSVIWTETIGNSGGLSLSKLNDENYISIGGAQADGPGEFLFKVDKQGKKIWSKPISGYNVLALPDNGFLALTGNHNDKVGFLRFDKDGNQLWNYQPGTA